VSVREQGPLRADVDVTGTIGAALPLDVFASDRGLCADGDRSAGCDSPESQTGAARRWAVAARRPGSVLLTSASWSSRWRSPSIA
jgi:hypothetical protein